MSNCPEDQKKIEKRLKYKIFDLSRNVLHLFGVSDSSEEGGSAENYSGLLILSSKIYDRYY